MTINLLVIGEVKFFMKKIISMCLIIPVFFSILCFFCVSKAETAPVYDATYNNNAGAFYANGTPITINTDSSNNTVVYWDGGSQVVPSTVTIFGGGTNGTSYKSSNITMENGTVSLIYGGGISLNENEPYPLFCLFSSIAKYIKYALFSYVNRYSIPTNSFPFKTSINLMLFSFEQCFRIQKGNLSLSGNAFKYILFISVLCLLFK